MRCYSHVIHCDVPVMMDSYEACSYGCHYCFRHIKRGMKNRKQSYVDTPNSLQKWIDGYRNKETNWCDWNIPLHWGNKSDPFQPIEWGEQNSLKMLRILKDHDYPIVISTKSDMLLESNYKSLLGKHVALQLSLVSPKFKMWESKTPTFKERLDVATVLVPKVRRVIIRIQPYVPDVLSDILRYIPEYAKRGIHGVTIEGLKWRRKNMGMTERYANYWVFPRSLLLRDYEIIKDACHDSGLRFYCAESRLRLLGDSVSCCGVGDIPGFNVNKANLNTANVKYTEKMKTENTGYIFSSYFYGELRRLCQIASYKTILELIRNTCIVDFDFTTGQKKGDNNVF